jgi:hypothetical protein
MQRIHKRVKPPSFSSLRGFPLRLCVKEKSYTYNSSLKQKPFSNTLSEVRKGFLKMVNKEQAVEECDATKAYYLFFTLAQKKVITST